MNKLKSLIKYFTIYDALIWGISISSILITFFMFDKSNYMNLSASLIGITALIFIAKGNFIGHFLIIVFSVLYGIISFRVRYYGEMITYVCMSAPMALIAIITWIKNPYENKKVEVKIYEVNKKDLLIMLLSTTLVTILFYFILKYFNTANLIVSTISVSTSFAAAFFSFKRSRFFALAYSLNDLVLVILWTIKAVEHITYLSLVACFFAFLINDIYSFVVWSVRMKKQIK